MRASPSATGANVAAFVAGRIDLHQCGVASFLIMLGAQAKSQSTERVITLINCPTCSYVGFARALPTSFLVCSRCGRNALVTDEVGSGLRELPGVKQAHAHQAIVTVGRTSST